MIHLLRLLVAACGLAATTAPSTSPSATTHPASIDRRIVLDGTHISYRAVADEMQLHDDDGKPTAKMFYIAYTKNTDGATTQPTTAATTQSLRPVTFIFNGGPGAASVWLHLGAAGPERVKLKEDGFPPKPPYQLTENSESWLDLSDLVFIDPVGTGYSRANKPEEAKSFYSTHADVESVADFIRLYCTHNQRWLSPKYLAGESYGTTRAAALSEYLHDRFGLDLNGIVLISTVLNFQTLNFSHGNDTGYPLYLPTYTAVAHYHKKLSADLEADFGKTIADAQQWAQTTYAAALQKGSSLDDTSRKQVIQQLAAYTGLSETYVSHSNLRISPGRFEKALLFDEGKVIGRFDGRLTGDSYDELNDTADFDPSLDGYLGVFSDTISDYLRRELKFETDEPYEVLSPKVGPWIFRTGHGPGGYLDVASDLTHAISEVPSLKVLICCGYYDLATPFGTVDYTVNSLPLSKELRGNITEAYFPSGHMIYLNPVARVELKKKLTDFFGMTH